MRLHPTKKLHEYELHNFKIQRTGRLIYKMEIPSETVPWILIKFHSLTISNNTAKQQASWCGIFQKWVLI
jgi:hypothetical protein